MHILYFHQYFTTPAGAGGTRSYEMAKHLVTMGHKVTMVYALNDRAKSSLSGTYINGQRRGAFEGINLVELDLSYSNKMNFFQRAKLFLRYSIQSIRIAIKEEHDVLFATSTPLTASLPGIFGKWFGKKRPFVFEVRDLWPELPKAMGVITNPFILKAMDVLETLSYRNADACVALSPGIQKGIRKKVGPSKTVELIPNACDLELFVQGKKKKTDIPGIAEGDFVATFTGAHGFANGLDAALDAAKVLLTNYPQHNIKLVFVGDGIKKKDLLKRKEQEGLSNCVFLDPVPKTKLVHLLQASDVGLMLLANVPAFYYGTSPNKFFDYIALGLPVLNNYPGWLADMITQNSIGLAVPPDNAVAFAEALVALAAESSELEGMGQRARDLAERSFSRSAQAEKLRSLLEAVAQ